MFPFGGLQLCLGGLSPIQASPRRRDWADCGQKSNKLQIILFLPTNFYEWVQLMLLLYLSEGIKITLQRTYNAVNYRLGQSAQWRRKLQNSKLNRKT